MKYFTPLTSLLFFVLLIGCSGGQEKLLTEVEVRPAGGGLFYSFEGEPYTGVLVDKKGSLLHRKMNVKKGYLAGPSITYFFDGSISTLKEYKKGVLHGSSKKYRTKDFLQEDFNFVNGRKEGEQIIYYPSGAISKKLFYRNGNLSGKNQLFYLDGQLRQEFFFNEQGRKDSVWRKFHQNGMVKDEIIYQNGEVIRPNFRFDGRGNRVN